MPDAEPENTATDAGTAQTPADAAPESPSPEPATATAPPAAELPALGAPVAAALEKPARVRAVVARAAAATAPLRRLAGTGPGQLVLLALLGVAGAVGIVVGLGAVDEPGTAAYAGEIPGDLLDALIVTVALVLVGVLAIVLTRRRAPRGYPVAVRATWLVGGFGLALGAVLAVVFTVGSMHDTAGLDTLQSLGSVVDTAASVTTPPGLTPLVLAIIVAVVTVAALVLLVPQVSARVGTAVARVATPVAVVLVLVASLLFLGGRLDAAARDLESQVTQDEADLATLVRITGEMLAHEVAVQLHERLVAALPPAYRDALPVTGTYGQFADGVEGLRRDLRIAAEYDITDEPAEALLATEGQRLVEPRDPTLGTITPDPADAASAPSDATHPAIAAVAGLVGHAESPRPFVVAMVGIDAYTVVVNDIDSAEISRVLREAAGDVPIAEPLLAAYAELFTVDLGVRVRAATERIVADALRLRTDPVPLIEPEARAIVAAIDVSAAARRAEPRAQDVVDTYTQGITDMKAASDRLIQDVADILIPRLSSASQDTVREATGDLGGFGRSLSKAQVNKIVSVMRTGARTWQHSVRPDPEDAPHCREVTTVSVRYYAAGAIQSMDSPYVSDALQAEARRIRNQTWTEELVADPGWICFYVPGVPGF